MSLPDAPGLATFTEAPFKCLHDQHGGIAQIHRAVKQVCHLERFHVSDRDAIHTHIFSALRAFIQLEWQRAAGAITRLLRFTDRANRTHSIPLK